ncbi:MAG: adenylate kinase [Chloroflexi bacterium]|nr:adenylate kinase [Chloroflexota bacterium]
MRIILLGAPGSGKGTQAVTLAQQLKVAHISSGDLFREEQAKGTELGKLAKQYMERGELVPNEVTIKMILGRISQPDCKKGYILDGFPMTLEQGEALEKALAAAGKGGIDKAAYIEVPIRELLRRLSGRWICRAAQHPYHAVSNPPKVKGKCDIDGSDLYQRPDDSEETAKRRLQVYTEQTAPLIQYYKKRNKLAQVDGGQDIEVVGKTLLSVLQ